jgi:hypothetical protein
MLRYGLAILALIGFPLAMLCLQYLPLETDNVLATPITDYRLEGRVLTYETPLNNIDQTDLVSPIKAQLTKVNIYLTPGPEQTAYPYLVTRQGTLPANSPQDGSFYISGDVIEIRGTEYKIRYNTEILSLPDTMAVKLSAAPPESLRAIWHIRANGPARLAGVDINGDFIPYQFSLKSALLGLTQ